MFLGSGGGAKGRGDGFSLAAFFSWKKFQGGSFTVGVFSAGGVGKRGNVWLCGRFGRKKGGPTPKHVSTLGTCEFDWGIRQSGRGVWCFKKNLRGRGGGEFFFRANGQKHFFEGLDRAFLEIALYGGTKIEARETGYGGAAGTSDNRGDGRKVGRFLEGRFSFLPREVLLAG